MTSQRTNEADERTGAAGHAGRRPVFGPLFYSTLVVAAIVVVCVGGLRVSELVNGAVVERRGMSPGEILNASVQQLAAADATTRSAGAKGLAGVLMLVGPAGELSGVRAQAITALRHALADADAQVRADAALALTAHHGQLARSAKAELTAALNDKSPDVRIAAARALLTIEEDSPAPALGALAKMLADPLPVVDRKFLVTVLRSAGQPGLEAAVKVLLEMLRSPDELLQFEAVECVPALEQDAPRVMSAVEPLFNSKNPEMRYYAIFAAVQTTPEDQAPQPGLMAALEGAVLDKALPLGLREKALDELLMRPPDLLVHCGRALARQIDDSDYDTRLAAATLLRMIEPQFLAGPRVPGTKP